MKKRIIVYAACIAVAGVYTVEAQNSKATTVQEVPVGSVVELPAPPPPPVPPVPPVPPLPPVPPVAEEAPLPPVPPLPPLEEASEFSENNVIINENGYEISVHSIKGVDMVIVKKDGKEQKIKLSTWMANKKYYDKKFGMLPPPPPPPKPVEEVKFTPPVIEKDQQ